MWDLASGSINQSQKSTASFAIREALKRKNCLTVVDRALMKVESIDA
jgi:hypothetical protein